METVVLPPEDAEGAVGRPPAEPLGEEAGAALSIGAPQPNGARWLLLVLPAASLADDAAERAAALVAEPQGGLAGDLHLALPRAWQPPRGAEPAALALPAPGVWRADALLREDRRMRPPELLCRLLLAETLSGIAAAHRRGLWHGLISPSSLWLAGASPERLVADCPRDPRVVIVGCGVLSLLTEEAQTAAVARAPRRWVAPELLRTARPGPHADLWAAGAIARALLPLATSGDFVALLDQLQATQPDARPTAEEAEAQARELALAGLARWQRSAPPPPRLAPTPEPLFAPAYARAASRSRSGRGGDGPRAERPQRDALEARPPFASAGRAPPVDAVPRPRLHGTTGSGALAEPGADGDGGYPQRPPRAGSAAGCPVIREPLSPARGEGLGE